MKQYQVVPSTQFRRDLKLAQRRGCAISRLTAVIKVLAAGGALEPQYRDHPLSGDYTGCRECHIQPDWLLVYRYYEAELLLYLVRSGSHSDLF